MYPKSRSRKKARSQKHRIKRSSRFTLETLNPRLLLSANNLLSPPTGLNDLDSGVDSIYAQPGPVFSDPSFWGTDNEYYDSDLSSIDMAENLENDILNDYNDALKTLQAGGSITSGGDDTTSPDITPSATAMAGDYTLFLDFDGGTVYSRGGDFWLGSTMITVPAYDLSKYGWTGQEQQSIDYISQFVTEDYAAYNINVTTVEPTYGEYTTIYVGGTNDWFRPNSSVIGVATYDVGNWDASNYGFAFSDELSIYNSYSNGQMINFSEYLANLVSHEAAHTFGLNHVSDTAALMNPYLPISPRTNMFGSATIPGTQTVQDSEQLLAVNLGYESSSDDFGDTIYQAGSVDIGDTINGLLERRNDTDAFTFTATATGTLTAQLTTTAYGNLDSYLSIYRNSDNSMIAQNDDNGSTNDSLASFAVTAGQDYTVVVSSANNDTSGSYSLAFDLPQPAPQINVTDTLGSSTDHSLDFGSIIVDTSSTSAITITNEGSSDLVISELLTSGSFALNKVSYEGYSSDDITIAPGDDLTVTVTFNPEQTGTYSGNITIVSNDTNNSNTTLQLTGQAELATPDLSLVGTDYQSTTGTLDFGNILRGNNGTETLTISNNGSDTLIVSDINIESPFVITGGFSGSALQLSPGSTTNLTIAVTPDTRGAFDGQLTITSNDPDSPNTTVDLIAQGVAGQLRIAENAQTANDNNIDLGTIYVGETAQQTITLSNIGDADLDLTGLTVSEGFLIANDTNGQAAYSTGPLAPGESINVIVSFVPDDAQEITGSVTVSTNDYTAPVSTVDLHATAISGALEINEADGTNDGQLTFGSVNINDTHTADAYTLTNYSGSPITITMAIAGNNDLDIIGGNSVIIAAGATHTVSLELDTDSAAAITDTLTLTATGPGATTEQLAISADAYALIGGRSSYSFQDDNDNTVKVALKGSAQAELRLGTDSQPDIRSIRFLSDSDTGKLTITSKASTVQLGDITGTVSLTSLKADNTELVGDIDIDGQITKLQLGSMSGDSALDYSAETPASLRLGTVTDNATINIDGPVRSLRADQLAGDCFTSDSIARMLVSRDLDMDINVTAGNLDKLDIRTGNLNSNVQVNGTVGKVNIRTGDLNGTLNATGDITRISLRNGDITGTVFSASTIGRITANNIAQANISASQGIDRLSIRETT